MFSNFRVADSKNQELANKSDQLSILEKVQWHALSEHGISRIPKFLENKTLRKVLLQVIFDNSSSK